MGFRNILGIPPTHIDRTTTVKQVFEIANQDTNIGAVTERIQLKTDLAPITPVTQTISNKKLTVLSYIIRAGERNPRDALYQVTFEHNKFQARQAADRRVGRPRIK